MSLFGKLKSDGLEQSEDRLGGFQPFPTDIYTGTVKVMYAVTAKSGAQGVVVILDLGGKEYRETIYVTNKNGDNWFPNKDDPKKKVPLPGFTTIDDLCLVATGKSLADQAVEDKVVKVWDSEAKKEVNKSMPVLIDAIGQRVSVGVVLATENKTELVNGDYKPISDTRQVNTIDKVYDTDTKLTVAEARNGQPATFWDAWVERNKGQVRDKRTLKDGASGQEGRPGGNRAPSGPPAAGGAQAPKKSLFGPKAA